MDTAQLEHIVTAVLLLAAALALLRFLHTEYRLGKIRRAAVETARATAYHKHPEMQAVLTGRINGTSRRNNNNWKNLKSSRCIFGIASQRTEIFC